MTGQAVIGALRADLILNTAQLEAGVSRAGMLLGRTEKSLMGVAGAAERSGNVFNGLRAKFDSTFATSKQYEAALKALDRAHKQGLPDARYLAAFDKLNAEFAQMAAPLTKAQVEMQQLGAEQDRLRARFNPLSVVTAKFKADTRDLSRALEIGAVDATQYAGALKRLETNFEFNKQAINGFGSSAQQAGFHSTNLFFQMQDITTMMASGQSPWIMAMQQGPQVVGIFKQIENSGGSMGASLLGAFRSLVSPVSLLTVGAIAGGAALFYWATGADDAGKEADKAKDPVDALNAAFDRHKASAETATTAISELRKRYGEYAQAVRQGAAEQAERDVFAALKDARPVIDGITSVGSEIVSLSAQIDQMEANLVRAQEQAAIGLIGPDVALQTQEVIDILQDNLSSLTSEFGVTGDQAIRFSELMAGVDAAVKSENMNAMAAAASEALAYIESLPGGMETATGAFGEAANKLYPLRNQLAESVTLTGQVEAASNGVGSQLARAASNAAALRNNLGGARAALAGIGAEVSEINRDIAVELKALNDGVDLQVARKRAEAQRAFDAVRNSPVGDLNQAAREFEKANAEIDKMEQGLAAVKAKKDALSDKASKLSDAQKALKKTAAEVKKLNEAFEAGKTPIAKFRAELKKLDELKLKGLSDGAYADGVRKLTEELGKSSIIGDLLSGKGLSSFWDDFTKSGTDAWAGILTNAFSQGGAGFSAIQDGLTDAFDSLGNLFGGGGGPLKNIAEAIPGLQKIAAAIKLVQGLVGGKSTTDTGFKGTITTGGLDLKQYTDKNVTRLFGLINNSWTEEKTAKKKFSDPLLAASNEIQGEIMEMAETFGFGSDAFKKFAFKLDVSLKGLTEDEALDKLKGKLASMGDSFAAMIPSIDSAQELATAFGERMSIDQRIMQLRGDEAGLQEMLIDATHELNRERMLELLALEKAADAAAEREAAATERDGLRVRLLRAMGREEEALTLLRQDEIDAFREGNQALAERVIALEDEAALTSERLGLEEQLLELRGDQAELDRRWLDQYEGESRAIAEQIVALREAEKASDAMAEALGRLSEEQFASALDFARAQNQAVTGLRVVGGATAPPAQIASASQAGSASQTYVSLQMTMAKILNILQGVQSADGDAIRMEAV